MAGIQDFVCFEDDFLGARTITAAGSEGQVWEATITGDGGPAITVGGINGEATLALQTDAEVQNLCMAFEDDLNFDIDLVQSIEMRVKMGQAAADATTMVAFGLASARNDAIASIAARAMFRVVGSASATAVVVETDDGATENASVATGKTLVAAYKKFYIDFTGGKSNVKFYIDGDRVAAGTTFDMSGYALGLQPYVQIQKTSNANGDTVVVDYVSVKSRRPA